MRNVIILLRIVTPHADKMHKALVVCAVALTVLVAACSAADTLLPPPAPAGAGGPARGPGGPGPKGGAVAPPPSGPVAKGDLKGSESYYWPGYYGGYYPYGYGGYYPYAYSYGYYPSYYLG